MGHKGVVVHLSVAHIGLLLVEAFLLAFYCFDESLGGRQLQTCKLDVLALHLCRIGELAFQLDLRGESAKRCLYTMPLLTP